jgi:hypothetical protein
MVQRTIDETSKVSQGSPYRSYWGLEEHCNGRESARTTSVSTTERHHIKDVPESTLNAMKLLETLCNPCATRGEEKPI